MTLYDVRRLSSHFKRNPPLRMLVAACAAALGVKFPDPDAPPSKYLNRDEVKRLLEQTGGRIPGVGQRHG